MPGPTTTCKMPATCMYHPTADADVGVCSLRCNPGTECPSGGRCIEAFTGATHCFKPCAGLADCHAGLTCTSFDEGGNVCIPDGWMDDAPLTPPM